MTRDSVGSISRSTRETFGLSLPGEKVKTGRRVAGYRLPEFDTLSGQETAALMALCQSKIDEYIEKHGEKIWSHRKKFSGYISATLKYEVLKRAKFRCEPCGISAEEKAPEVDYIVPRNPSGTDDITNL